MNKLLLAFGIVLLTFGSVSAQEADKKLMCYTDAEAIQDAHNNGLTEVITRVENDFVNEIYQKTIIKTNVIPSEKLKLLPFDKPTVMFMIPFTGNRLIIVYGTKDNICLTSVYESSLTNDINDMLTTWILEHGDDGITTIEAVR